MKLNTCMNNRKLCAGQHGNVMFGVLMLCTALLVTSAAFFSSMNFNRRVNRQVQTRTEAREGADGAARRATSCDTFATGPAD